MFKKLFKNFIFLLYLEFLYGLFTYSSYLRVSIVNIVLFTFINSVVVTILTNIFNDKVNKIISYAIYCILPVWYSIYYIFNKVFNMTFSISLFKISDQALQFGWNTVLSILENIYFIILLFIPLIIIIVSNRRKIKAKKRNINKKRNIILLLIMFVLSIIIFTLNIIFQGKGDNSTYRLYFKVNNNSLNIERLGVINATIVDIERSIFGFKEEVKIVDENKLIDEEDSLFDYGYNVLDLELPDNNISDYINGISGTKKNKYTGMFKDYNLIYIVAESFSELAVSEELTPTLYKLVNNGFIFSNFYSSNNSSTIGGEFGALTGLYADSSILSRWRSGNNYYPYGLGNVFKNLNYDTFAYHNNSYVFQDRNIYLKSQGFDNFKGCYNGMEKIMNCNVWPQSDVEMVDATVSDYMNSDKFMAYYMTVSGHFYYSFSENSMAKKNRSLVDDLPYSENVKGYIATQIELDRALELLLQKLEEANKLDNTVIVLVADHYPYRLTLGEVNEMSSYQRDNVISVNKNNLIIYNSKMKNIKIDKVGMPTDIVPTIYNLFGIDYDSRLFMGSDLLSDSLGIAYFTNSSWVTDKGVYYASSGEFKGEDVDLDYISNINSIVSNKRSMSRQIIANNYYNSVKFK